MSTHSAAELESLASPDDEAVMARVAAGEVGAFEVLYDRFSPVLYPLCLRILREPTAAQTVLLEVFEELWQRREKYDPSRGSVRTYLATLTRSRAIDAYRAVRRQTENQQQFTEHQRPQLDDRQYSDNPQRKAVQSENGQLVRQALASLPPQQRDSLQLAYFEGLTHQQIADRTNTPLGSVKTYIRQGLMKLRSELQHLETGRVKP